MNPQHHRRSIRLPNYDYSQMGMYFITICTHNRICRFGAVEQQTMRLNPMGEMVSMQWQALPQRFAHIEMDAFVVMPNHIHGIINIVGAPLAGAHPAGAPLPTQALHQNGRPLRQNGRPQGSPLPGAPITTNPNTAPKRATVGAPLAGAHFAGAHITNPDTGPERATARVAPTVGDMVGAYKSLCVHDCLQWINTHEPPMRLGKLWQRNYWEHVIRNEQELNAIRQYIVDNPKRWHEDALYSKE